LRGEEGIERARVRGDRGIKEKNRKLWKGRIGGKRDRGRGKEE
jgi:hypothetical protein